MAFKANKTMHRIENEVIYRKVKGLSSLPFLPQTKFLKEGARRHKAILLWYNNCKYRSLRIFAVCMTGYMATIKKESSLNHEAGL